MNISKQKHLFYYCILISLTAFFLLFFSTSTSPLHPNNYGYDSAYYRFIGLSMLKGKTPYKDIWDNKGPVLYFIQAIGALHGTNNEKISVIFLLQILSAFFSIFIIDRTDLLFHQSRYRQIRFIFFVFLSGLIFSSFLMDGNLTEEWSLPMISLSLYFFARYAVKAEKDPLHPRIYALWHGICFALITFIRINNAVTIFTGCVYIGIYLIIKKQWKNLFENLCFGILGIAVITLPIFVYLLSKHILSDMLYAVFLYNFNYAASRSHSPVSWHVITNLYSPIIVSALLLTFHTIKHKRLGFTNLFSAAIITANAILLIYTNTYSHYFIIYIPVFLFILTRFCELKYIPSAVITAALLISFFRQELNMFIYLRNPEQPDQFSTASAYLPKDERDSAIAINVRPGVYLNTNITPISRFAAYQRDFLKYGKGFEEEFIRTLQEKKPLWIIGNCSQDGSIPYVEYLPDLHYELRFNDRSYCFFRQTEQ